MRVPGHRRDDLHDPAQLRRLVLDQRYEPGQRPRIASPGRRDQGLRIGRAAAGTPAQPRSPSPDRLPSRSRNIRRRDAAAASVPAMPDLQLSLPRWDPEQQRVTLAAAAAQRGRAEPTAPAAELVDQVQRDPGAGGAERVPDGDGAAVDVDLVLVDAEVPHRLDGHRRERLVDLDQVQVRHGHARPCPARAGSHWTAASAASCPVRPPRRARRPRPARSHRPRLPPQPTSAPPRRRRR